jgi:hypothetical protein
VLAGVLILVVTLRARSGSTPTAASDRASSIGERPDAVRRSESETRFRLAKSDDDGALRARRVREEPQLSRAEPSRTDGLVRAVPSEKTRVGTVRFPRFTRSTTAAAPGVRSMSTSVTWMPAPVELALQPAAVTAPGRGVHDRLVSRCPHHIVFND